MDIVSRWQKLSEDARLRFCLGLILTLSTEEAAIPFVGDSRAWDELIAAGFIQRSQATSEQLRLTPEGGQALMHVMERHFFDALTYVH